MSRVCKWHWFPGRRSHPGPLHCNRRLRQRRKTFYLRRGKWNYTKNLPYQVDECFCCLCIYRPVGRLRNCCSNGHAALCIVTITGSNTQDAIGNRMVTNKTQNLSGFNTSLFLPLVTCFFHLRVSPTSGLNFTQNFRGRNQPRSKTVYFCWLSTGQNSSPRESNWKRIWQMRSTWIWVLTVSTMLQLGLASNYAFWHMVLMI